MPLEHYKVNTTHYIIDKEVLDVLCRYGLENYIKRFSIAHSESYSFENGLHIVGNFATDGEKLIIFERGWKPTPEKIAKATDEITALPLSYPYMVFYGGTVATFLKLGKLTVYANVTRSNVALSIPGGEVYLPRKVIDDISPKSYTDLLSAVYEYGGTANTKIYSRSTYRKAVEKFLGMTIVPYFDIVILISKKFVYKYDGERIEVYYPFRLDNVAVEILENVPLSEIILSLTMMP